jgi:hypothetical protein
MSKGSKYGTGETDEGSATGEKDGCTTNESGGADRENSSGD